MLKRIFKAVLAATFRLLLAPMYCVYVAASALVGKKRAFVELYEWLAYIPGTCGRYARAAFLRYTFKKVGEGLHVGIGTLFSDSDCEIGSDVYIGPACSIGKVIIGDKVLIASHVSIINGGRQHGFDNTHVAIREQPGEYPLIHVGEGAWIGERAVVMADVGQHSIVGAGAVVTRPVPPFAIVAGNPARILRYRTCDYQAPMGSDRLIISSGGRNQPCEN
jgi:acetyltransferase-like isoleucine patch superfamily enzyme